jgi:hypothetical protein
LVEKERLNPFALRQEIESYQITIYIGKICCLVV